ncbi:response regulator [Aquabacterium sp.]|uniref:response regulator n=1 Tax=Aquabacterium sp. TaxID=1872578 RepID=UPI003D6C9308
MSRILIIEDTPANLQLTMAILEGAGHMALSAQTAEHGLRIASSEPVDLILMDMRLPGIDGMTATRLLKDDPRTGHIPIIALTASAMKGDEQRMRAGGCSGYVAKPIRYQTLLQAIDEVLAHHDKASTRQN